MANFRIILRGLARAPLFTITSILSLALGIGANTAMFSMLDQLLLRLLPVKNPSELAYLYSAGPWQGSTSSDESGGPSFSYPLFRELQKTQTPFVGLAGARSAGVNLAYQNQPAPGSGRLVSGNYFELLGVPPALGRVLTANDDGAPGGNPVVVLSYGYWTTRFGNDPGVLNQKLVVNGYPMTIVGVAERGFTSERLGGSPEVYLPVSMAKELSGYDLTDRKYAWVTMLGRLKPGMTLPRAEAEINAAYHAQLEIDAQRLTQPRADFVARFLARRMTLKPGEHGRGDLRDNARTPALLMLGLTALVLLIACANVANLQLARSATRAREVAVRLAIGASRGQLIRQLLAESCTLALAGGVLGLGAAYATMRAIVAVIPPNGGMKGMLTATLDVRALLFCLGVSVLSGLLFGLFPALHASKASVASTLKDQAGQTSGGGSANAFRKTLVSAQVAVSLLLLISGGLFGKTLVNLTRLDLGMRVDHLITFSVSPKLNRYSDPQIAQFHQQLTEKLAAIPGVTLVSSATIPAIAGSNSGTSVSVEGFVASGEDTRSSAVNSVGVDYFRTMGVPLISGREFRRADAEAKVAIINEAFARKFLQGQDPLGRHLGLGEGPETKLDIEIIGVVKDAKYSSMREPAPAVFYQPMLQRQGAGPQFFYLRTQIPPENTAPMIQREVAALDPNLPVRDIKTMQMQIEENLVVERIVSSLTAAFAGLATLLAAVGLYGVLAFNVARRTREIGIRMALGAAAEDVRGLVVGEVALMLLIGTVLGVAAAVAGGKLVQSMLFEMKPWDTAIYAASVGVMWAVALVAAYVPARRATRVDPLIALRYE